MVVVRQTLEVMNGSGLAVGTTHDEADDDDDDDDEQTSSLDLQLWKQVTRIGYNTFRKS